MLSLLIVGVLGLLGSLLVASTKSSDTTAGTFVAQYRLDKAATVGPPEDGNERTGVEEMLAHEEHLPVPFHFREVWTPVAEAATYGPISNRRRTQFGPDLYHVEVTVWWMVENPEDGRAEGGGKRTVTLERLISFAPDEE